MKHSFLRSLALAALAGVFAFSSCQKINDTESVSYVQSEDCVIYAAFPATRTANSGTSTVWVSGDRLSAFHAAVGSTNFGVSPFDYVGDNTFNGRVSGVNHTANDWYMVYPYNAENTSPQAVGISVLETQTQNGNSSRAHMAGEHFPLYGSALNHPYGTSPSVSMVNALSAFRFAVLNTTTSPIIVKKVELDAPVAITGNFTGDITAETVVWVPGQGASASVVVNVTNGTEIPSSGSADFFAGIAPFTLSAGEALTVRVTAVHPSDPSTEVVFTHDFTRPSDFRFAPGAIIPLTLDFEDGGTAPVKQDQNLIFAQRNVTWSLDNYAAGSDYNPQAVSGAMTTPVTYTSSNPNCATITSGGQIHIVAAGETEITATAPGNDQYYTGSATYILTITPASTPGVTTYTKVNALTVGGTYLITSIADDKLFKGNIDGSAVDISPVSGVITDASNSFSAYEFTVEQSGSNYYLKFNDGKYLVCDYTNGNGTSGLRYVNAQSNVTYPYALTVNNGAFEFNTTQMNSSSTSNQVLYYKTADMSGSGQNAFKIGGSGVGIGVHLYLKSSGGVTPDPVDPTPTGDVYKRVEASEVTSGYNWAGTYLFVDEGSSKAFAAVSNAPSGNAVNVTISNGQIVASSAVNPYALTVTDAGVNHANASGQRAYDVRNSDGKYVFYSSNTIQIADSHTRNSTDYYHAFSYSNNGVQVLSSGNSSGYNKYYLGYSSSAFGYSQGSDTRRVQLYRLTDGGTTPPTPGKIDQTVTFSQKNVTWTLGNNYQQGNSYPAQVPGGDYQTSLSYDSNNTGVVTVSGNNLRIVGTGTATITATAIGNDSYNQASDTYTLTIEPAQSQSTERTYTYQTSVSAGTYLIGGYESSNSQYSIALFPTVLTGNWQSSQGAVTNGQYFGQRDVTSSNTLTFTNDSEIFDAEVDLIASGSNWKIKINKTGQYLTVPNANNVITFTNSESSATAFTISGGGYGSSNMGISSGGYYFYHSGSAKGFSMRAYEVTNIRLYKLTSESGTSTKQDQAPYFPNAQVTQTMATASGTLQVQAVQGAQGTVTYDSTNPNVATVSGTTITVRGFGSTTIVASAAGNNDYNPGSASYTLNIVQSGSSTGTVYTKATALTVGGTYLITDVDDQRLFKGNADGSYVAVSPSNGVITDTDGSMGAYEFTVTQSGSKYCIRFNDGKYLMCDYNSTSGNNTTGLTYEQDQPDDQYLYSLTVTNGVFFFMTAQRNSSSTSEYLYYKPQALGGTGPDKFKIGGSGSNIGVHLYLKGGSSTKPFQNLSFANSTVTLPLETASGTYNVQAVQGAAGSVTYTSSNPSVATVNGTTITVTGFGETRISANAAETSTYAATSLYYTLVVSRTSQEGVWNLENDAVNQYLTAAMSSYPNSSSSVVGTYARNVSASNRLDWPNPVTVSWPTAITGTKYVVIYSDAAHASRVDYVGVTKSTSSSALVYNLIPGKTYYYGVVVGNSEVASGTFSTDGRRRMMKVGDDYGQNFANNCRDFGGQVTTDGRHIKYGKIFRGTNMDGCEPKSGQSVNSGFGKSSGALGDSAKVTLLNYMKIELDVDLRGSGNTLGTNQNSALGFNDITVGDANTYVGHTKETYAGTSELTDSNKQYNGKTRMGVTLTRIMNAAVNGKNVYIHCMVGADRTGFTCLMLESVLGVSQAYCDMDYEMTSFSGVGSRTRGNSGYVNHYSSGINAINNRQISGTFQDKAIDYIVNVHGVDRELINRFQNAMLE